MALYGFQLYLEEDKHWYVVIPLMALLVGIGSMGSSIAIMVGMLFVESIGLLTSEELKTLTTGLEQILGEVEA